MIESMILQIKPYLPFHILRINWSDDNIFQVGGLKWSFTTSCVWRICSSEKMIFGCYDDDCEKQINFLNGLRIIDIDIQTADLKIDPVFVLSNNQRIEIFSTTTEEPWILQIEGLGIFKGKTNIAD